MRPFPLSPFLPSFRSEDHLGDFAAARRAAGAEAARQPGFVSRLWLAAVSLLQGEIAEAEAMLEQAGSWLPDEAAGREILARFRLICRYEAFERMPTESNIFSPDVAMRREKAGGLPRKQLPPLAAAGHPELEPLVDFLNERLQHWEWRSLRNLLRGLRFNPDVSGTAVIYRRQLDVCRRRFEDGDIYAAICAGGFCRGAGENQQAIDWLQKAFQLAQQRGDAAAQANALLLWGDWLAAPFTSPLVWNLALEASSDQSAALPSTTEALEFTAPSAENLDQARIAWEQAQALFAQASCARGQAQVMLREGYLAMLRDEYAGAEAAARQARHLFQQAGDHAAARLAETHRMLALAAQSQYPEAEALAAATGDWGQQSGSISWTTGLALLTGRFARHLMLRRGQAPLAMKAYRLARTLCRHGGANYHAAQYLTDIGEVYKATGQTEAAVVYYEQAADEIGAVLDADWQGVQDELNMPLHTRAGIAVLMSDNFLLGMRRMDADLMDRSIARMAAACDRLRPASTPGLLAEMPQIGHVFGLYENLAEQNRVLSPLYRARALRERGDLAGFEAHWRQAHAAMAGVSPEQQAILGSAVWGLKREWNKAADCFRQFLSPGGHTGFLADMMVFIKQFGAQGQAEIELQQYRFLSQALSGLVRTKQFAEALPYYETLGKTFGDEWWTREESPWLTLSDCGEMMAGLGRLEEALDLFDLSLAQLDQRRRRLDQDEWKIALAGSQNTRYIYAYAARTALEAGKPERAFHYAEQGKARGLLDLMAENRFLAAHDPRVHPLWLRLRACDARRSVFVNQLAGERARPAADEAMLQLLSRQLADVEAERQQLERELAGVAPALAQTRQKETATPALDEVIRRLGADTLLVEYLLTGDDLLIWAIDRSGILRAEAFKVEEWVIKSEIYQFRQAITERQPWQAAAAPLTGRLLTPIAASLQTYKQIIFVPHGALHTVPFQALPLDGTPLGLSHTLGFLPSAGALLFLAPAGDLSRAGVLAVGNPTGDLPAAAVEARLIAEAYGSPRDALIGPAATEAAVRARLPQTELVHIATHGYLSEEAPMQSALAFAHGEQLTLAELMGIQLQAQLVVLSACDTARGAHTGGDDVLGLTRGLIAGGARAAVVSLWQVNDLSTALLMSRFYQHLKEGLAPAAALREAQVYLHSLDAARQREALEELEASLPDPAMRRLVARERGIKLPGRAEETKAIDGYDHPYYWAAFVVVGSPAIPARFRQ